MINQQIKQYSKHSKRKTTLHFSHKHFLTLSLFFSSFKEILAGNHLERGHICSAELSEPIPKDVGPLEVAARNGITPKFQSARNQLLQKLDVFKQTSK